MMIAKKIVVKGIVQGVGFRPFIYKNATKNNLKGFVNNTSKGVFIEVEGYEEDITYFIDEIKHKPPVLSKVTDIKIIDKEIEGYTNFKIIESKYKLYAYYLRCFKYAYNSLIFHITLAMI